MKTDLVNRFVVDQIVRHRLQKGITVEELARGSGTPWDPSPTSWWAATSARC